MAFYSKGKTPFLGGKIWEKRVSIVLYTIVLIKRKQDSYFSCVVFLSIVVNHAGSFLLYECDY